MSDADEQGVTLDDLSSSWNNLSVAASLPLPEALTCRHPGAFCRLLSSCIAPIYAQGIVHGDLSSWNILLASATEEEVEDADLVGFVAKVRSSRCG